MSTENHDVTKILTLNEYNKLYDLKKNRWKGPCNKETEWCFKQKYNTPIYGYLYNKELFKCCNDNLMYLFNNLNKASELFGFRFFLDYGSLIGCLRNGKRIPWDVDIDVGILMEDFDKFKNAWLFLTMNGEELKIPNDLTMVYKLSGINNIHIDIGLYKKVRKKERVVYITSYSERIPSCSFLEEDLLPFKKAKFENIEVLIPNKSREYLERNYGEKCIENPITKHCYINNYVQIGSKGDLPDKNAWEKLLRNKKD